MVLICVFIIRCFGCDYCLCLTLLFGFWVVLWVWLRGWIGGFNVGDCVVCGWNSLCFSLFWFNFYIWFVLIIWFYVLFWFGGLTAMDFIMMGVYFGFCFPEFFRVLIATLLGCFGLDCLGGFWVLDWFIFDCVCFDFLVTDFFACFCVYLWLFCWWLYWFGFEVFWVQIEFCYGVSLTIVGFVLCFLLDCWVTVVLWFKFTTVLLIWYLLPFVWDR